MDNGLVLFEAKPKLGARFWCDHNPSLEPRLKPEQRPAWTPV